MIKKTVKKAKITKRSHSYIGYSRTYNIKDTASTIRNKLKD